MKVRRKDWQSYEELAARIYESLDPSAVVKHNDSIFGYDTETERQIDVSIRTSVCSHDLLVIVQVRHRKRPPNVNDVGEFAAVVADVRASKGVMVCLRPPGKNAKRLAEKHRIEICTAVDAGHRNWAKDLNIPVLVRWYKGTVTPELTVLRRPGDPPFFVHTGESQLFVSLNSGETKTSLLDFICDELGTSGGPKPGVHRLLIVKDNLSVLAHDDNWFKLHTLTVHLDMTCRNLFRYCRPSEYVALKNHSTGRLDVTRMYLPFPPLSDSSAWADGSEFDRESVAADLVPLVSLEQSCLANTGSITLNVLGSVDP